MAYNRIAFENPSFFRKKYLTWPANRL